MWKWIVGGIAAAIVAALGITFYIYDEPDIPRVVLEAKYAAQPSQFVELDYYPATYKTRSDVSEAMISVAITRVHYRDRGPRDAPVLLLLHGSNSSLFDWEAWSRSLSSPIPEADRTKVAFQGEMVVQDKPAKPDRATGLDLKGGTYVLLNVTADGKKVDVHKLVADAVARVRAHLEGFRVISVDLPGHGLTGAVANGDYSEAGMVAFVKAFMNTLGIRRFALAGNSMGGGVAARFAEMYPDRVTHLILVDAHAWGISTLGDRVPLAFQLASVPVIGNLLLYITPRSVVKEGLEDAVARRKILTDDMIDQYWDFARMAGTREATLKRFRLPHDTYVHNHIAAIKAPTLILWGRDDRILDVASAQAWHKAIPGSKLIVYPATGHLPMEEVPQKSAADVRSFISLPH